jgi:hypothetical protein
MSERSARMLLGAGALSGIALAVFGAALGPRSGGLPPGAVAMVGATPIGEQEYRRAIGAVEADLQKGRAPDALRRHVLDRLIDEELLVQAAIALGLPAHDPRLRGQIASAMLEVVIGEARETPGDRELEAFLAEHPEAFLRRARVQVIARYVRGTDAGAQARAEVLRQRLASGESGAGEPSDPPPAMVPASPLTLSKLGEYVGSSAAGAIGALPAGGVAVLPGAGGLWVAGVLARADAEPPSFEEVRSEVLAEWRRVDDDRRLSTWLGERRRATAIATRAELP